MDKNSLVLECKVEETTSCKFAFFGFSTIRKKYWNGLFILPLFQSFAACFKWLEYLKALTPPSKITTQPTAANCFLVEIFCIAQENKVHLNDGKVLICLYWDTIVHKEAQTASLSYFIVDCRICYEELHA